MGFKCGIVGLPNVGKSTLFNALTRARVSAANYPFCTIDPHVGIVEVPDPRLQRVAEIARPQRVVPTTIEFVDIAGLVAGASKGEGLGNQFLAHVREVDAIAHVVRCFEDPDVTHVTGAIDPRADIETVNTELALADLETVEKAHARASARTKSGAKDEAWARDVFARVREHMNSGAPLRALPLSAEEKRLLKPLCLLTDKPTMYVANVSETGFRDNPRLEEVRRHARAEGAVVVPVSAAIEAELAELAPADKQAFLADLGLEEPGLDRVIRAGYALLGLITFFTTGPKEAHAWTVPTGTAAPQAAGAIHSDFERGFIRAEVAAYEDYVELGGEAGAREAGKLRIEGKDYRVQDGDVIHFRFNV